MARYIIEEHSDLLKPTFGFGPDKSVVGWYYIGVVDINENKSFDDQVKKWLDEHYKWATEPTFRHAIRITEQTANKIFTYSKIVKEYETKIVRENAE
jgi:hypothetical protein